MGEREIARQLLPLLHGQCSGTSAAGKAVLAWIGEHRGHFWPELREGKKGRKRQPAWESLPRLAADLGQDGAEPPLLRTAEEVAKLLAFDPFEHRLLRVAVGLQRLRRIAALRQALVQAGEDLLQLVGMLAGGEPSHTAQSVRRSLPVTLGLLEIEVSRSGLVDLDTSWSFDRLLDRGIVDEDRLIEALAGIRQHPALLPADFAAHHEAFSFLRRLLAGALERGAEGVNLLIHGPPGTGKTEFARTLAAAAGARLYAVGEADAEGEEPTRYDRLHALKRAHRLLARRRDSLLLFDEMEDLLAPPSASGNQSRAGSKLFVNRLLEANPVPTIWTSNSLDEIDPAHLRRMSFVLAMKHPSPANRARIVARIAAEEKLPYAATALQPLVHAEAETGSVARVAIRSAALAGGEAEEVPLVARSLLMGLRGGRDLPPSDLPVALDLDLYESDPPIPELVERIVAPGAPSDVSLLLTGPPGTGKTALAAHFARRFDRPLLVKRASDLLSKWVGGTEANIADAFAEAREDGALLFFDEADSLIQDRSRARQGWEVTQVNELLSWMDAHPLPFIAATNHPDRLDPAALRRFVFKLDLHPLSRERAATAFSRFFGCSAPPGLERIAGLAPGDFAVVARQLRFRPEKDPAAILRLLEAEARAKPMATGPIGF
jgi:AAA+ superfamily predicted ATPase